MIDWSLDPIFGSYGIVAIAAIGFVLILALVRETGRISRRQGFALWFLRLLICLLVLLILLRPGITFTRQTTPSGTIAVMMDASASMLLPSGEGKETRWELEKRIWESLWSSRESLGKDTKLVPYLYDSKLKALTESKEGLFAAASPVLPERPDGATTDVGGPLAQLMSDPLDSPLSAVIWMGDATQTHSPAGSDPQQMARRLSQLDVPMYIVGVGPRSNSENAKDLAVEEVPEQLDAFTKNPLNVRGLLRCRGVANAELLVKLLMIQSGKPPKEISVEKVKPTKADQAIPFQLRLIAPEPGSYELAVRAEPVSGEAVADNNEATVYLNVRGGGARILYIEGEPRQESKFIRQAITESEDLTVTPIWISKPPHQKWPVDLSQNLADGIYDCFILGDIDYRALDFAGASTIAEQVKKGAGLVTLGGYYSYGPGGWDGSPLREIIPVDMSGTKRQELDRPIDLLNHVPEPVKVVPIGANEILQIDTPDKNAQTWGSLKPLLGANRWQGVRKSPGTVVLAQSLQQHPLIVSGLADKGRVVSLAFDSTYVWWRQGKINEHKAFWRKIIYWCLRREAVEEGMQLSMPQRRIYLQQPSEMILQWNGGSEFVEIPKNIRLHLWKLADRMGPNSQDPDRDLGEVAMVRRDANSMKAQFSGSKEGGRFEWRASVVGSKGQMLEAKLPFVVVDRSVESMQPVPDWQLMNQMAKLNAAAGGTLVAPEQTEEIVKQILDRRKMSTQTAVENRRLGDGDLDTWAIFLLLGMVMIGQWWLRKKWNLP